MKALALCGTLTACLIALASPVSRPLAAPAAPIPDAETIQGVWERGNPTAESGDNPLPGMTLAIDGRRFAVQSGTAPAQEAEFTLDSAAQPKTITVVFPDGRAFGIYELRGDTLRLCISEPGPNAVRPTEFRSFGPSVTVSEFRRMKGTK